MSLQKEELDRISLWVRFPNLNLSCRTPNAPSRISSFIGQPICMDKHTAEGSGLDSARVLIDVSVASPLLDSVKIHCLGKCFSQEVEYAWKPIACPKMQSLQPQSSILPDPAAGKTWGEEDATLNQSREAYSEAYFQS